MVTPTLRRSFIAFHYTLGFTLLYVSLRTALHALGAGPGDVHVVVLSLVEGTGAALFLIPGTLRIGAILLLLTIGLATVVHLGAGQFRGDLVVYATGTWFVMVHGPGWSSARRLRDVAAT